MLRPGRRGRTPRPIMSTLLDAALAQLPVMTKADDPERGRRAGPGGLGGRHPRFRGRHRGQGFRVLDRLRHHRGGPPGDLGRSPSGLADADDPGHGGPGRRGSGRDHRLLDLSAWRDGVRAVCRREEPHVGAQFNLFDPAGWRHQVFITNSTDPDIVFLEARHRGHARVEDRIKDAKDLGLLRFPGHDFAANAAWLLVVGMAQDLTAWTQRLCLDGELAQAEPKRLRYCLWHTAGRLVRTGRRLILRIDATWPWATEIADAFQRLRSLSFAT